MNPALKSQSFVGPRTLVCPWVVVSITVRNIDESIVLDAGRRAFEITQQRSRHPFAFDDITLDAKRAEIARLVKPEEPFASRRLCRACDNVVIADSEVIEWLVDPDYAATGVTDQIVVKLGRTISGSFSET